MTQKIKAKKNKYTREKALKLLFNVIALVAGIFVGILVILVFVMLKSWIVGWFR